MNNPYDADYPIIHQIDQLPYGPESRALIDQAIQQAEETNDNVLGYAARMRLTETAHMMGDTDAMLSSFGWCLGMHDSDPVQFPLSTEAGEELLFHYKWMPGRLTTNPGFSLQQIDDIHHDMERRYREAGASQNGVLQSKFSTAMYTGRLEDARALQAARNATEEDDFSHCAACVRNEDAWFAQLDGNEEEAIRIYDEIFDNNLSCGEEPETSEGEVLLPYLRAGRWTDARAAHLRSYRVARSSPDMFSVVANSLIFCAITGNEARGLALLERNIHNLANDPLNRSAHFEGLLAVGVLLDAVTAAGYGSETVRGAESRALTNIWGESPSGNPAAHAHPEESPSSNPSAASHLPVSAQGTLWTAETLAPVAWRAAEKLAVEFDARNGNDFFTRRLVEARALRDEHYDVPLDNDTFRAPEPTANIPTTAEGWCERAIVFLMSGEADAAKSAIEEGLRLPIDDKRAALLGASIRVQQALGNPTGAEEAHNQRVAELRASGRTGTADLEQRLGMFLYEDNNPLRANILRDELEKARQNDSDDEVVVELLVTNAEAVLTGNDRSASLEWAHGLVSEALTRTTVSDPHGIQPSIRLLYAHLLLNLNRVEEALVELDALTDSTQRPRVRIPALTIRSQLYGATNNGDAGAALGDELISLQTSFGNRTGTITACILTASLLSSASRNAEAAQRIRYALTQAKLAEYSDTAGLSMLLGRYLHYSGEPDIALEHLDEAYRAMLQSDTDPAVLADILYLMGEASRAIGEDGLAFGAWQEAWENATAAEDNPQLLRVGFALGTLLSRYNNEDALTIFAATVETARVLDDPQTLAIALQHLGGTQGQFEQEEGLTSLDEALSIASQLESPWLVADITDTKARVLHALERVEEAASLALQAADGYASALDADAAARSELFVARLLAEKSRSDEAAAMYQSARERVSTESEIWVTVSLELAEALEALGRHSEAAVIRAEVDTQSSSRE
ncbi:tetratricopeptide repeat protein [Lysinibacter sp. HNR]|uniref:tetratricopeptide repeat protein n=1 Tax=Lysinibacter sp. HNR TaxID=3031408 RepID=UPI002435DE8E|nr:tetratricopeptide repeat protein [Lysinibacter sp. HNR]WGD37234.1 tetratricopeptide repeat protein [Lysinibacter sp. HNR]